MSDVELITPREVPLGGQRAMTVRRTLPTRERTMIGAWCFLDHYGPDDVADTGGMSVAPHPHTGLQTVSWLFTGEIEHRDSAGHHAMVRPGELNLMTAGHGISHSEVSTPGTTTLHGAQLWLALPDAERDGAPTFEHYAPAAVAGAGWTARVFLGSLLGDTSPVTTFSPLLGAELLLEPGAHLDLDVEASYEHGVLVDTGVVHLDGVEVAAGLAGVRRSRLALAGAPGRSRRRAPPGARRRAVRRADRHVVELRRPHPRRGGRVARRVAGPARVRGAAHGSVGRPVRHPGGQRDAGHPGTAAAERPVEGTSLIRKVRSLSVVGERD